MRSRFRRMFQKHAEASRHRRGEGIAEGGGVAFQVVGGMKQFGDGRLVEAMLLDAGAGRIEPVAFLHHPVSELARQVLHRRFRAGDRIVVRQRHPRNRLGQLVDRLDDLVIGESENTGTVIVIACYRAS